MSSDPDTGPGPGEPGSESPESLPGTGTSVAPEGASALVGGRIVVGVDDSEQAAAALRWALAEGVLRGATVEVVHSWSPPLSALPFGATLVVPVDEAAVDSTARGQMQQMVADALAEMEKPAPEVQITVLPGSPGLTLIEVSEDADLLVVGSHGRGGIGRLVLGSVAMACVQHAHCPVVVIRTPQA